ncbi:MAG: NAD-dependent epimerase/dehydratase family protein [Candidatus Microthrix sp.]|nr:NAD-dependent epimerase/dehydratase family protein [Candidatus Microthrix sp.]MBK7324186.1 NAD-dependent epimerase/dehydratase family protein [Candidatus Microthrix sp.]
MSTADRGAADTVLVTGAAGFIGSRLVGRLEADGRSVRHRLFHRLLRRRSEAATD